MPRPGAIAGITGTRSATGADVAAAVARLRRFRPLPVAVGFGIRSPEQAREVARAADAAVVGNDRRPQGVATRAGMLKIG
jgi:tryptophan synthase alpha chain